MKFAKAVSMDLLTAPMRVYTTLFNNKIAQGRKPIAAFMGTVIGGSVLQSIPVAIIANKMSSHLLNASILKSCFVIGAGITATCVASAFISDIYQSDRPRPTPMPRTQNLMGSLNSD